MCQGGPALVLEAVDAMQLPALPTAQLPRWLLGPECICQVSLETRAQGWNSALHPRGVNLLWNGILQGTGRLWT